MQTLSRVEDLVAACDERQIGDKLRVNKSLPGPLTTSVERKVDCCYLYTNSLLGTCLYIFSTLWTYQRMFLLNTGYDACAGDRETWKLGTRCLCNTARNQ